MEEAIKNKLDGISNHLKLFSLIGIIGGVLGFAALFKGAYDFYELFDENGLTPFLAIFFMTGGIGGGAMTYLATLHKRIKKLELALSENLK